MNRGRVAGFTVIETMLFLSVSGLLIVGVLVASGGVINAQRYRDANTSLLSFFQSEYDRVANVQNVRDDKITCSLGDTKLTMSDSVSSRGTSECVILGRLIRTTDSGGSIRAQTVYSSQDLANMFSESGAQLNGDVDAIRNSTIFVDNDLGESYTYSSEWGTRLVRPKTTDPDSWQMLIIRSPASGAIRTYVSDDQSLSLDALVDSSHETERLMCLDSRGLVMTGNRGVMFSAGASGAAGVKLLGDGQC